jgi:hypothetical protein
MNSGLWISAPIPGKTVSIFEMVALFPLSHLVPVFAHFSTLFCFVATDHNQSLFITPFAKLCSCVAFIGIKLIEKGD